MGVHLTRAILLACALGVTASCSGPAEPGSTGGPVVARTGSPAPPVTCPVTRPRPRPDYPAGLRDQEQATWQGSGTLWVDLANFSVPAPRRSGTIAVKHAWWTGDASGRPVSARGAPDVTARRLDGQGGTVTASHGGHASTSAGEGSAFAWWPTILRFPEPGCWRITGSWQGRTITAVVRIPRG